MKKENKYREQFEKEHGYDVYSYSENDDCNAQVIGFCQNYVEELERKLQASEEASKLNLADVSNRNEVRELLSGFSSLIHKNMSFLDAHSPHVHIDDYLATL